MLRFVSKKSAIPPLGLLTVAAMLPKEWHLKLVDLNVERLRDEDLARADWIMISAMIVHKESVHEIAARCQSLGKKVIAGGPSSRQATKSFRKSRILSWARRKR